MPILRNVFNAFPVQEEGVSTMRHSTTLLLFTLLGRSLFGQANGKLQIHSMDVGQGDGTVLISPQGQVVLFDGGDANDCGKPAQ